jgi:hypothetical protein
MHACMRARVYTYIINKNTASKNKKRKEKAGKRKEKKIKRKTLENGGKKTIPKNLVVKKPRKINKNIYKK